MTFDGLTYATWPGVAVVFAIILDALVRPRSSLLTPRRWVGVWLLACITIALYGLFLALCGNGAVAVTLALAVQALLLLASNTKHAMLGEPLLFSDLALLGAVFRHPQFYLSTIRFWQRAAVGLMSVALLAGIAWLSVADLGVHIAGLLLLGGALAALLVSLTLPPWRTLARVPDADGDTRRLGLLPVLLLYWLRWRASQDPPACSHPPRQVAQDAPELAVIIQCESFADPADLFGDSALSLPGLAFAREHAWQWGGLQVSGFGAYTMRTEYGVLFGRGEEALGFRRYDPFLTALGEASWALPARLQPAGWRSAFLHPHDMRFYGRDEIMPAGGFAELVGEERFVPPGPGEGRYVTDAAIADRIVALAEGATQPSLLYAVTIENHGPWARDGGGDLVDGYLRLVRNSDAMLTDLITRLGALKRPALLLFFGDHRPSIPGATMPGGARDTPYVMIRMDDQGRIFPGDNKRVDITPAELHHAVLDTVLGPAL